MFNKQGTCLPSGQVKGDQTDIDARVLGGVEDAHASDVVCGDVLFPLISMCMSWEEVTIRMHRRCCAAM